LKSAIAVYKADCVIVDYAFLGPLLIRRTSTTRPLQIIVTHDLLYQRSASLRKVTKLDDFQPLSAAKEAQCLADADVLMIEPDDQVQEFHRLVRSAKLVIAPLAMLPHVVDGSEIEGRCLFVGSEGVHNIVSLRWFLERVWPIIMSKRASASLTVCGGICDVFPQNDPLRQLAQVDWRGRVSDLPGYYRDAQVCIVP
jgi:hypothetical protein